MALSALDKYELQRSRGEAGGPSQPLPPAPPGDCPIVPLGQYDDTFHFFDHLGQVRRLSPQALGQKPQITALFGAAGVEWLVGQFPAYDKEGNPTGSFNVGQANLWLIQQSAAVGLFDPTMPERRVGLWRAGDVAVLHLGDQILWGDTWRRPGFKEAGALWRAEPARVAKAPPAPPSACIGLEALMGRWHWQQPGAAGVMFGLWAAGLMGAAVPWRPHGFIVGEAGSGKSTLFRLLAAANPLAVEVNDYTEAGLRQTLSSHASAALLDEADADQAAEADKLQRVIGLLRRTSGGSGAVVLRGSAGGASQRFEVVASAIMGAILPPILLPQDASRITRLDVLRRAPDGPPLPTDAEVREIRALGPAFLARAMEALPRFAEAFAEARAQLLALDGEAPRVADQVGAILAARHVMQHDGPMGALGDELDILSWAIPSAESRAAEGGPQQALHHLLHATLDMQRHGERPVVWRTVLRAQSHVETDGDEARRNLLDHGMRWGPYPLRDATGPPCLYVMNNHPQLARIFAGTRWAGGKWTEDLARLRGAIRPENPVKLAGGVKVRCVVVPADLLPARGDGGDTEG